MLWRSTIALGVNPTGAQDELQDPGLVRDRSFLPVRAKGLGLTRTADIAHSAFCGAIELVLPRFPEATDEHMESRFWALDSSQTLLLLLLLLAIGSMRP